MAKAALGQHGMQLETGLVVMLTALTVRMSHISLEKNTWKRSLSNEDETVPISTQIPLAVPLSFLYPTVGAKRRSIHHIKSIGLS